MSGCCLGNCIKFEINDGVLTLSYQGKQLRRIIGDQNGTWNYFRDLCEMLGFSADEKNKNPSSDSVFGLGAEDLAALEREVEQKNGKF